MKKARTWLGVGLFVVIVAAAVVVFILPALGDTAPGGPELSFGGSEICQLDGALEEFNAAGFYMAEDMQAHSFSGQSTMPDLAVYLSADRAKSCGKGRLVNKSGEYLRGAKCMVYSFSLRLEDGGHMTCDGTETLGNTREAINAAFGTPAKRANTYDTYHWSKLGRGYDFTFYYDDGGVCGSVTAAQDDPKISFTTF